MNDSLTKEDTSSILQDQDTSINQLTGSNINNNNSNNSKEFFDSLFDEKPENNILA